MKTITLLQPVAHELTPEMIVDVISLVDEVPPTREEVQNWTETECLLVYDWATREYQRANDHRNVRRRPKPWILGRLQEPKLPVSSVRTMSNQMDAITSGVDRLIAENDELKARVAALESGALIPADWRDTWHYKAAQYLVSQYDLCKRQIDDGLPEEDMSGFQSALVRTFADVVAKVRDEEEKASVH